jgi:hypothetical protein
MFYTSDIKNIPSVKILTKVVKELGLYWFNIPSWQDVH